MDDKANLDEFNKMLTATGLPPMTQEELDEFYDDVAQFEKVVDDLPHIEPSVRYKREMNRFTRRSEYAVKAEEKEKMERSWASVLKTEVKLKDYDAEVQSDRVFSAGKASYVERNYEMIDDSDFCVFYYNEAYLPPRRKRSKRDLSTYQPKSGTRLAYEYAIRKSQDGAKIVINTYISDN